MFILRVEEVISSKYIPETRHSWDPVSISGVSMKSSYLLAPYIRAFDLGYFGQSCGYVGYRVPTLPNQYSFEAKTIPCFGDLAIIWPCYHKSDNSSSPYFSLGRSRIKFTTNEKRIRNHLVFFSPDFVPFDWYINTRTSLVCFEGKIERSPIARL